MDLEKAVDNVRWNVTFNLMRRFGLKYKNRSVILNCTNIIQPLLRMKGEEKKQNEESAERVM